MENPSIGLSFEKGICFLKLDRPEAMNALTNELIRDLSAAIDQIAGDKAVRVLVICGHPKVFAAGGDIRAMATCTPRQAREYIRPIHKVFSRIAGLPQPTIAAVSGFALGGGVELSLACDFRIAADNARFGFPETGLGIFPAAGGSQRLPRLIGISRAKELMMLGENIDASTALAIGLVNRVVPTDGLMDEVKQFALKMVRKAPLALKALKSSIHLGMDVDLHTGLELEMDKCCSLFATGDQKEGMQAFMEKRPAVFKGE